MRLGGRLAGTALAALWAVGCSSSNGAPGPAGTGGQGGAGGSAGAFGGGLAGGGSPAGTGGTTNGAPPANGGSSAAGNLPGSAGTGGRAAGAGGSGPAPGGNTGGSSGTSTGGAPGSVCAGAALTTCAGTMMGAWCVDTFFAGNPAPPSFTGVWSDGPTDVWAVAADNGGAALHWDGCAWTQSPLPSAAGLEDVWGASSTDVWAVGFAGTALHWDGSAWSAAATGTTSPLGAVSGTSGSDVWAVGVGVSLHWDGTGWSIVPGFPASSMFDRFDGDVWAVAPNDVWAALGLPDGLAHFDGTSWTTTATPFPGFGFFGIWTDGTTGWAVGEGQQILQLGGGTWTQVQPPSGSAQGSLNVMSAGGDVWIAGQAVVEGQGGGAFQPAPDVPPGVYQGLWLTSSQIWIAGSSNDLGNVVLHRAR